MLGMGNVIVVVKCVKYGLLEDGLVWMDDVNCIGKNWLFCCYNCICYELMGELVICSSFSMYVFG